MTVSTTPLAEAVAVLGPPAVRRSQLRKAYLDATSRGERVWWLVANPAAAEAARASLAEHCAGLLSPGVATLRQAANQLVRSERPDWLPLGPAAQQALIDRLASNADHRDGLGPLKPLLGTPGLTGVLASRFRQLRRDEVGPEAAGGALRKSDGEEAGSVLARLYRDYVEELHRGRLLDDEEALLQAAAVVGPNTAPAVLLLDLPLGVTPLETRFLRQLAKHASAVHVSIAGNERFAASTRLSQSWATLLGTELRYEPGVSPIPAVSSVLANLRDNLFDDEAPKSKDTTGIELLAGGGSQDTARRVTRRVKELLASDAAKPRQIVLAAPRLDSVAPRYAEALAEYGVPFAIDAAPRLSTASVVQTLRDLLAYVESDGAFDRVIALLGHRSLTAFDEPRAAEGFAGARAATEWFVRELQVPSGRRYLLHEAERLAERSEGSDTVRKLAAAAQSAHALLDRLAAACDALPHEATPLAWLDACDTTLRHLGHRGLVESAEANDRRAGDVLEEAAASIEALAAWRGREPRLMRLGEFARLIDGWATRLRLPAEGSHEGRVRIVGLPTATCIECEHLFVVEASESAFAIGGPGDANAADDAMLLFHELASTPTRSLTFAYSALDDAAQPMSPSPFVTDVERLFANGSLRKDTRPLLSAIDDEAEPASPREWRLQSTAAAAVGEGKPLGGYAGAFGVGLIDSLSVISERARGESFGPFEGVVDNDAARRLLLERFGPEHLWSASQLELMATCPYKFFSRQVLRMDEVGELTLSVDHRRRGSLMHDALAECLTMIAAGLPEGRSLRDVPTGELADRLIEQIDALANSGKLPQHEAALAAIEARQATDWAARYADQQAAFYGDKRWRDLDRPLSPTLLEARFGPAKGDDGAEDRQSTDEPLRLTLPSGETLLVTGRIDRIDTGRVGDRTLFTVVDYKTSKDYTAKRADMESGKQLQPVLYALAAQQLLLEEDAVPVGAGYWAVRKKGFVAPSEKDLPLVTYEDGEVRPSDDWQAVVDAVTKRCEELVNAARVGEFPMHNDDEHCGRSCEFSTICRVGQTRSLGKTPPPAAEGT
ncbi:MAG: PD-(D/E)XK nuclease family protein [Planctomycetota bacterium]